MKQNNSTTKTSTRNNKLNETGNTNTKQSKDWKQEHTITANKQKQENQNNRNNTPEPRNKPTIPETKKREGNYQSKLNNKTNI